MKTISTTYCRRFDNSCYHHQCISGFIVLFLKICSTILGTTIPKIYKIVGLLAEDTIRLFRLRLFRFFIECTIGCKSAFTTNPTLCAHFAFVPLSIQQQCYAGMRLQFNFLAFCCFFTERKLT